VKKADKIKIWIFIAIFLSLIVAGAISIYDKNWTSLGMSILTMCVILLPSAFEKRFKLDIPSEFEIVLIVFIYAAIFLGEQGQFYNRFWWWDKILHSFSGLILGNVGFLVVRYLNSSSKMDIKLSPIFVAVFSFVFAVAMGAIWEIYEYFMDNCFGFFMQRGSLDDTMTDLILDTIGALVFAVLGYFEQKGKINIISKYIVKFKL